MIKWWRVLIGVKSHWHFCWFCFGSMSWPNWLYDLIHYLALSGLRWSVILVSVEPEKKIDEQDRCKCAPAVHEKVAAKAESWFFSTGGLGFLQAKKACFKILNTICVTAGTTITHMFWITYHLIVQQTLSKHQHMRTSTHCLPPPALRKQRLAEISWNYFIRIPRRVTTGTDSWLWRIAVISDVNVGCQMVGNDDEGGGQGWWWSGGVRRGSCWWWWWWWWHWCFC